jgi:hypothetical protein
MTNDWLPIAELRPGHYAVARCLDGHEVDIYRAGNTIFNVATGQPVTEITGWRRRSFDPPHVHP